MQVKKFEKLNLSKFDAFKQSELSSISCIAVEGGGNGGGAMTGNNEDFVPISPKPKMV